MTTQISVPKLKKSLKSGWRVEYYEKGKRQVIRVEMIRKRFKSSKEAEVFIQKTIIEPILQKMEFFLNAKSIQTIEVGATINDLVTTFAKSKAEELEGKNNNTWNQYKTIICYFEDFIEKKKKGDSLINQFKLKEANEFVLFLRKKGMGNSTVNQYIQLMRTMWQYGVNNDYCEKNIFKVIKKLPQEETTRRNLTKEELQKVTKYCKDNNYNFYVFLQLSYTLLVRPIELFRLQIKDIDFEERTINLNGDKTKNYKKKILYIPNQIWEENIDFFKKLKSYSNTNLYIFSKKFEVGVEAEISNYSSIEWRKLRKKLNLPKDCQLYGIKHTGITDMLEYLPVNTVRMQAGHSSIAMTSHYANHINESMKDNLRNVKGL